MEEAFIRARPEYRTYTTLVTEHALSILRQKLDDLDTHLCELRAEATRTAVYPDGTLLIEGGNSQVKMWNLLIKKRILGEGGICQPEGFTSLEPFPYRPYGLWYTTDYAESLGEFSFSVTFPGMISYPTSDYSIADLQITVKFKRRPGVEAREQFARFLGKWFKSVEQVGVFGEGPITASSPDVRFCGKLAQLRLNASRSGQDTLNWLLLSVLNFGYEVCPVQEFIFDQEKRLSLFVGPLPQDVVVIPLGVSPAD